MNFLSYLQRVLSLTIVIYGNYGKRHNINQSTFILHCSITVAIGLVRKHHTYLKHGSLFLRLA